MTTSRTSEAGILVAGGASYATGMILPFIAPLMVDHFIRHYGLQAEIAGTVATLQFVVLSIAGLAVAPLLGRVDAGRVAAISGIASAGGCLLALQAPDATAVVVALLVANVGQGAAGVAAMGVALSSRNPPRSIAFMASVAYLYGALWLFLIPQMEIRHVSAAPVLVGCAIATAIPAIVTLLGVRLVPRRIAAPVVTAALQHATQRPLAVLLLSSQMAVYAGGAAGYAFAVGIATKLGFSMEMIGVLLAAMAISSGIGPMVTPLLRERHSLRSVSLISLGIYAIACGLSGAGLHNGVYAVSALVVGLAQGMLAPLIFEIGLQVDPSGKTSGRTYSFLFLGYAVGPLLGGFGYGVSLLALGMVCAVTATVGAVGIGRVLHRLRCDVAPVSR